ncbi:hypothetical protein JOC27_000675 [Sporolactobacillus spathodeae]|uniref:Uncharacterized protein n=1 Tax=Sporolactobacillus spathodeae TaxID=1465502 RepID=A0ABS2Q7U7_9BACL|nr:hypothetical protein [Sporolactobacillus spathodeae]
MDIKIVLYYYQIEKIKNDMKVTIEKTKHIILAVYSMPDDDFIYRNVFAARRNMGESE